jgi:formylglycine-generating enzyme required for sulfatase activity
MVVVPAGEFMMGSPENESGRSASEGPQRKVQIARPLAVGKFEVTVEEYEAFTASTGGVADGGGCNVWTAYGHRFEKDRSFRTPSFSQTPRHPAVCVSWQAATTYANWLTTQTGKKYRLLSEAEWEYAARGGSLTRYFFGESEAALCEFGNGADRTSAFLWGNHLCSDGVGVQTAAVGTYKANAFGLHDTAGNVWEWVQDCPHEGYQGAPTDGTPWMSGECNSRVIRGGSWDNDTKGLRSAARASYNMLGKDNIGFRVARELD